MARIRRAEVRYLFRWRAAALVLAGAALAAGEWLGALDTPETMALIGLFSAAEFMAGVLYGIHLEPPP